MKVRRGLYLFVILIFSVGTALLLLITQLAFSQTGYMPEKLGPDLSSVSVIRRAGNRPFGLEERSALLAPSQGDASVWRGWYSYPLYGGEMTSIAMDPVYSQTVYVGTRDAGVFKTDNGGQTWFAARTGLTFYPIRTLVVDPQNRDVLYTGTDYDGIWKSIDGGVNWHKSSNGLGEGLIVFNITIDPQNTDRLYAGLAGGLGLVIGDIYKSEDGGATWTLKDAGIPRYSETSRYTNGILTLAIDPDNPSRLYAGTVFDGAFMTVNGGETWTEINDGLPFRTGSLELRQPVNALAADPHHNHRLSAAIEGRYYVFEGGSWLEINQGSDHPSSGIGRSYLYFHPVISTTIYGAGSQFSKSGDGGVHWTQYLGWADSGHVAEIAFHPQAPDTIYAATDVLMQFWGGVYKSSDQGENWSEASQGITAVCIQSAAIDPQNKTHIYFGAGSGHLYRTGNGGITWDRTYVGGSGINDIAVDPQDSQKIYLASTNFYTSTNQGETLQKVDQVEYPQCIAVAVDAAVIYVGAAFGHGVYRSGDGGLTWEQKNQGLPQFGGDVVPIYSIAVDPDDSDTVWAGAHYGGGIVSSTDGGDHWQVKGLTENNSVDAIAVNPRNSDEILVGAGDFTGNIFKSIDGGDTWQRKISDISMVQDIVYDPRDSRWVYAATEGSGILRSFNGGESWYTYSTGIFYPVVYSLDIRRYGDDEPLLVTGSYGSGAYWIYPLAPTQVYLPLVLQR